MSCKGKTGAALKACQQAAKDRLAKAAALAAKKVSGAVVGEVQKVGNFFQRTFKNVKSRRELAKKRRKVKKSRKNNLDRNAIN